MNWVQRALLALTCAAMVALGGGFAKAQGVRVMETRAPSQTEGYQLSVYVFRSDEFSSKLECDRRRGIETGFDKSTQSRDFADEMMKRLEAGLSTLDGRANKVVIAFKNANSGKKAMVLVNGERVELRPQSGDFELDLELKAGEGHIYFEDRNFFTEDTIVVVKPAFAAAVRYPACTGKLTTGKGEMAKIKSAEFVMVTR